MDVGKIRVGTGGWTYAPWRGVFYPEGLTQKRELEYASRKLSSIEINGTFYGAQKPASFAKWHDETPDDFVFALKGPRYATNRKILAEAGESIERFVRGGVVELKAKLGPINWQFAHTKKFDPDDFEAFLKLLPNAVEGIELRHAVEVRHESFSCSEFVALAARYGVAIVNAAHPKYPQIADVTAPFVYVRMQMAQAEEALGYSDEALDLLAAQSRAWASGQVPLGSLQYAGNPAAATPVPRDVFIYMIAGAKEKNPAAAMSLMQRLAPDH